MNAVPGGEHLIGQAWAVAVVADVSGLEVLCVMSVASAAASASAITTAADTVAVSRKP